MNRFPRRYLLGRLAAAVSLALLTTSCGGIFEHRAATVWGEPIEQEDLQAELDEFRSTSRYEQLAAQGDIASVERQFLQGVLASAVRRAVLTPAAEDEGIEVGQGDVDAELELIKADFPDQTAFDEALKEQALTEERLRQLIADRILEDRLRQEVLSGVGADAADVQAFYDENIEQFQETCVQHILLQGEAEARLVSAELRDAPPGRVDDLFARLAKKRSEDRSNAENGGDLGCNPAGQFVAEFENAMSDLEVGEISDAVQSEFGFHVIRVTDRTTVPLEQVEAQILEQLTGPQQDAAWQEYLTDLYDSANVEIDPQYGVLDVATGQILDPDATSVPGAQAPKATEPTAAPVPGIPEP